MNNDTEFKSDKTTYDKFINNINELEIPLIDLIRKKLGIIIHKNQTKELLNFVNTACKKFECQPSEYFQMLINAQDKSPILEHLITGITVGETYFFRDKKQMHMLQDNVLPNIIKSKRDNDNLSLRIWSAGCASGEEIYTIAIMLKELLPDIDKWTINLLGTDINTQSMRKAIEGKYNEWSMRSIPKKYKEQYFKLDKQSYILHSNICELVKFDYLNLKDDNYPSIFNNTNAQDLILCRNVLIYFDYLIIDKLMKKLTNSLVPGGFLILGASDPINIQSTNLIFHNENGIIFERPNLLDIRPVKKELKISEKKTSLSGQFIHKKTHIITVVSKAKPIVTDQYIKKIDNLMSESKWQEVLDITSEINISDMNMPFFLTAKGIALANLGKLNEAENIFKKSLLIDSTNKFTYYAYALTLTELNDIQRAEAALRKTLFLDHEFVTGHYNLGLLYLRNKKKDDGLRCLRNALSIAKNKSSSELVAGLQHLTYGRLVEILGYEIDLYSKTGK